MAAGLGFKDFTTGEVLTAADVDGYLMQGVLVFASSAARDAAITSPQEGQFAFLKDTNTTMYYTGSAWANLDTTGLTNPMTTTGDMIYSSPGSTPVRLGIGSAGQVLTVASGIPSWAAPAGGGKVLQVVSATYATATTVASTTFTDTGLSLAITPTLNTSKVLVLVSQPFYSDRSGKSHGMSLRLLRGATSIYEPGNNGLMSFVSVDGINPSYMAMGALGTINYLDSPATTSATTYKTQQRAYDTSSSGSSYTQPSGATSTIILLEIGA